jgi:hypothetical protein
VFANQFLSQVYEGNVVLTFGQAGPPLCSALPSSRQRRHRRSSSCRIRTLARFAVSPRSLRELADALRTTVEALDALEAHRAGTATRDDQATAA